MKKRLLFAPLFFRVNISLAPQIDSLKPRNIADMFAGAAFFTAGV